MARSPSEGRGCCEVIHRGPTLMAFLGATVGSSWIVVDPWSWDATVRASSRVGYRVAAVMLATSNPHPRL